MHHEFDLVASDGTRLTAWRNGNADGPRVLICNGMGVPPQAWPRFLADDCAYAVASWNHRGVLGSDKPADPDRLGIEDHVSDAVDLLDALGWDDAVVVAWSLGVNVAFELARAHPDRVLGVLSVAGVPGGTFDTLFAPQFVPRQVRRPLALNIVKAGRRVSGQLNWFASVVPKNRLFAELIRHSIVLPFADIKDVQPWVTAFFNQDWEGYFDLAIALERHGRIDPSFIQVPVTVVAGAIDALTSQADVLEFAAQIPHSHVHTLPGSHCLPLEYPDRLMDLLRDLYTRAIWEHGVRSGAATVADERSETVIDLSEAAIAPPVNVIDLTDGAAAQLRSAS